MPRPASDRKRVPLRTIDDLERLAHEVTTAERDAVGAVSDLLRELAVRLPADSKFVHRFAVCARSLDFYRPGGLAVVSPTGAGLDVMFLVQDIVKHFEEAEGE